MNKKTLKNYLKIGLLTIFEYNLLRASKKDRKKIIRVIKTHGRPV